MRPMTVADFYAEFMDRLRRLGIDVHIWTMPSKRGSAEPVVIRRRPMSASTTTVISGGTLVVEFGPPKAESLLMAQKIKALRKKHR